MSDPYEKEMRNAQRKEDRAREKARSNGKWNDYHKASSERGGLMRDQWGAIAARENLKRDH